MKARSAGRALRHFGFRQTIRGALIVGVLGGLLMGIYGTVIVKTYPTQKERDVLVQTLEATPAINFLSGEVKDAGTPASYAIYKSLPMMTLITSIWGLMVVTRLLRGNEEDGRLELFESGRITRRQVAAQLLAGFGYAMMVSTAIMWALMTLLGSVPHVDLSPAEALYMTLAIILPGVFFAGLGVVTSQLTLTRSQAVMYGLLPLLVLYCIRGAANTSNQLNWLKTVSPFGWSDLIDAVLNPHLLWVIPSVILAISFTAIGLYFAGKRDYDTSLLPRNDEVRSHFYLLSSPLRFTLRQKKWTFFWWLIGTLAFTSFMAALAGMVSNLLRGNQTLNSLAATRSISSEQLKLLFIGTNFMILGLILLAMVITELVSIRRDEAKGYLDNLLVQPLNRRIMLIQRLVIIVGAAVVITFASTFVVWDIAQMQHITLSISNSLASGIGVMSAVVLVLGIGSALYGTWPRLAIAGMSVVVGWAFVGDIVRSLLHLDKWVEKTSVLSYIPTNPSASPDWSGIVWLFAIGTLLCVLGVLFFQKRDIVGE